MANDNNPLSQNGLRVGKMTTTSIPQPDWNHWILRLIALIIDSVIVSIIVGIIWFIAFLPLLLGGLGYPVVFPFIVGILQVPYYIIMEVAFGGATFGKKILGLQVQMTNGAKVTFDKSLIRNISKIYWIFLLLDWLVAIVTPGSDRRQKYTDRFAGTTVVQATQAFASVTAPASPSQ